MQVFADHQSSHNPIHVERKQIWSLQRRMVFFGTSVPTIFKGCHRCTDDYSKKSYKMLSANNSTNTNYFNHVGLTTEEIQQCFWRGTNHTTHFFCSVNACYWGNIFLPLVSKQFAECISCDRTITLRHVFCNIMVFLNKDKCDAGFVCVRGFDREFRAPRPLCPHLHVVARPKSRKMPGTEQIH